MARLTVFEPASPKEVYSYYKLAAQLAREEETAIVLRLTTHVCHAREKVAFGAYSGEFKAVADFDVAREPLIPITTRAIEMKRISMEKISNASAFIRKSGLSTVRFGNDPRRRGIITCRCAPGAAIEVLLKP